MSSYKETRNQMLGVDYSTKLSGFLAQGESHRIDSRRLMVLNHPFTGHITARQIHWAMMDFEDGKGPGENIAGYGRGENDGTAGVRFELLWRDYMRLCARKFCKRMFALEGIQDS